MIRCYGEHGVNPIVILYGSNDSFLLHSKYISESYITTDELTSVDLLLSNKDKWTGSLIISCTDAIASCLDANLESLKEFYHIFNCGQPGLLTRYMNKLVQTECAKDIGFDVPVSIEGLVENITECSVPYPRIIKPVESIRGGKHISICNTQAEFEREVQAFNKEDKVLVQQYIRKDSELVIVGLSIDDMIVLPGYIHKHRDEKGGTTYSSVRSINLLPTHLISQCKRLVCRFGYQGLFGIELIQKGNRYFFIEINLRNDATTYSVAVAGANLPMMYYDYFNGGTIDTNPKIAEITSIVEFPDFIHVLRRKVSIFRWIKQLRNSDCRYYYSNKDRTPYNEYRKQFVKFLVKKILSN